MTPLIFMWLLTASWVPGLPGNNPEAITYGVEVFVQPTGEPTRVNISFIANIAGGEVEISENRILNPLAPSLFVFWFGVDSQISIRNLSVVRVQDQQ